MSMTKKAIKTPQDMYGKKIGVQATNESVWTAFVKAAKIDASKITKVPVQFDPLPLTTGTVDGWFSFVTNEPNDLRSKGFDVTIVPAGRLRVPAGERDLHGPAGHHRQQAGPDQGSS